MTSFTHYFKVNFKNDEVARCILCNMNDEEYVPRLISTRSIRMFSRKMVLKTSVEGMTYDPTATYVAYLCNNIDSKTCIDIIMECCPDALKNEIYKKSFINTCENIVKIIRNTPPRIARMDLESEYITLLSDKNLLSLILLGDSWKNIRPLHDPEITVEDFGKIILNDHVRKDAKKKIDHYRNSFYMNCGLVCDNDNAVDCIINMIYAIIESDYVSFQMALEFLLFNFREFLAQSFSISFFMCREICFRLIAKAPKIAPHIFKYIYPKGRSGVSYKYLLPEIFDNGGDLIIMSMIHIYNLKRLCPYINDSRVKNTIKLVANKYDIIKNSMKYDMTVVCHDL